MADITPQTLHPAKLEDIYAARKLLQNMVMTTPLLQLNMEDTDSDIYLKLENLQPIGAFKVRPAANVILNLEPEQLVRGVFTASSGNMGIAVAWTAARLGLHADIVVPDSAPNSKLEVLSQLGATVHCVTFDEWWDVIVTHTSPDTKGVFIDGVGDIRAMAGDGTIGLEIIEQLPDVDTVLIPFGGGGLSCGIASAIRALKPGVRIIACESEMATPLTTAFKEGHPIDVPHKDCFISGIGVGSVLPWMWPVVSELIDDTAVVTLEQVANAVKFLAERNHVIAEGAGAVPVAAALSGQAGNGKTVCVISGGNIDVNDMIAILQDSVPSRN
ncbi:MAG: pyridoxal-phosphate dependent enzyme [Gammaproteobacteria bacterium]